MNKEKRDIDVVYGEIDLEPLYTFKDFPVFMGCTEDPPENDIKSDMEWHISRKSGAIQLNPLLPLDLVYFTEHGSGTVGKAWDDHHEDFSNFVNKNSISSVFEIGGLHGALATKCLKKKKTKWTIIEPNPIIDDSLPVSVIRDFFDSSFSPQEHYDTVVNSHVFEHAYNPDDFIYGISKILDFGGRLVFSIPNMEVMLERKYTNCVNFEHTVYLTEPYVNFFLSKHGFEIIDKKYHKDDHSIFYAAEKRQECRTTKIPNNMYLKNKKIFQDYIDHHIEDVRMINSKINDCPTVFLFGAHIFSQYLISFGLKTENINCILDNDDQKQGKRLYGTNMLVESPKILKNEDKPIVILRAGVYNNEIKKDIIEEINNEVVFV